MAAQAVDALVLCRVIDNFGDVGVCWRLARQLAGRGLSVALVLDDASALRWMRGPDAASQAVRVLPWSQPDSAWTALAHGVTRLVIEGFGCTAPDAFLAALPRSGPVLVNLEYLSAESYVERSHGLASPQHHGAAAGLTRWFYYPGFTPKTGGLLGGWPLQSAPEPAPPQALWFAYPQPRWQDWAQHLAALVPGCSPAQPLQLGLCPGEAQRRAALAPGQSRQEGAVLLTALDYADHEAFDDRLARSSVSVVRGEDSFARAQWAGRPFLWHIYPQDDGAHWAKLDAWLALFLDGQPQALGPPLRRIWHAFNDPHWTGALPPWPDLALWQAAASAWRLRLTQQGELLDRLLDFVNARSGHHLPG